MSRFLAETLDVSRLPSFELIAADYEAILAERLAGLKARLASAGVDYDVGQLETDPLAILEQEDAYRELLERQAINDAGRSLTLAYAAGPVLDHLAATLFPTVGVRRLPGEIDDRFRRRIALAPEAKSPGTLGGYEYQAMSAHPDVRDALALNHASGVVPPGEVRLQIVTETGAVEAEVLAAVRAAVFDRDVALATGVLSVAPAAPLPYDVTAIIEIPRGPDPGLVLAEVNARLIAYADNRRRAGRVVALSGLDAALHAPAVERVHRLAPLADIDPGPAGVAVLGQVNLQLETPLV
ncbi:baseplate J/gp47 family protein [Phenylobacterium sp.]|uniref:baseplate assembly protein n=1 Tax=Phenylobacterium sp. TaxID=1871053 RepID=UPI0027308A17|nr:baseplate J/gp47 family protein [Phenylobacterium sp.]MDP2214771.1 baseplate J/gp47 family protein [Phenylobacterium sp.]